MKITTRTLQIWLLIFIPFLCLSLFFIFKAEESIQIRDRQVMKSKIGKKFQLKYLYDQSATEAVLDFQKNGTTLIDFWFAGCKPCIEEMARFSDILSKTDQQITIVSISLDKPSSWAQLLTYPQTGKLSFLSKKVNHWEHYVLNPKDADKDPFTLLNDSLGVKFYPAYFAVDSKGYIIATPASAVKYLNAENLGASSFIDFTIKKAKSNDSLVGAVLLFVFYSGLYWIVLVMISITRRISRSVADPTNRNRKPTG